MIHPSVEICRSIRSTPKGTFITLTLKKGESWILMDQIKIANNILHTHGPKHHMTIYI